MKKFMEVVKRQTELATKAALGSATKEEIAELQKLNAVVKAATEPEAPASTKLATMTLAAFREWHEKAVKALEDGVADASLLAVVKRNIAAVKEQGKTLADDVVAVELPVEKEEVDKVAALEARIAELEAKAAEKAKAPPPPADDSAKATSAPTAQALAMEAVDALLSKYTKLKALIDSGSFTRDEVDKLCCSDWSIKEIIQSAAAVMAKADALKELAAAVTPELEKLDSTEKVEDAATDAAPPAEGDAETTTEETTETEKGDETPAKSRWESGLDLAPVATAKEQAAAIKAAKAKNGF
jgi:hypothetical protein